MREEQLELLVVDANRMDRIEFCFYYVEDLPSWRWNMEVLNGAPLSSNWFSLVHLVTFLLEMV